GTAAACQPRGSKSPVETTASSTPTSRDDCMSQPPADGTGAEHAHSRDSTGTGPDRLRLMLLIVPQRGDAGSAIIGAGAGGRRWYTGAVKRILVVDDDPHLRDV